MKTLDEVIRAMEWCTELDQSGCGACPYADDDDLRCYADDALNYLKRLRDMTDIPMEYFESGGTSQISCPKCHSEFVILPDANNPLTWSELKSMEGKPVWVEGEHGCIWNHKSWALIRLDDEYDDSIICVGTDNGLYEFVIGKEDYGTDWQAYRKENV